MNFQIARLFEITPLFATALLLGAFATVLYYLVMWRVSRAGVPVKMFATIFDLMRMFRAYRELAPSRGWPLWPITGFWVSVAAMFGVVLVMALRR